MGATHSINDITLEVNGSLVRFPGNEGLLVNSLLKAREQSDGCEEVFVSKAELERLIWGKEKSENSTNLYVVLNNIKQRCPIIIKAGVWRSYTISSSARVKRTLEVLPPPTRGPNGKKASRPEKPFIPELVLQIDGAGRQFRFRGKEADLLRYLLKDKMKYRNTSEISLTLGLDPFNRRPVDKLIISLRRQVPDLFETGRWGRGWRLNPRRRTYIVVDELATQALPQSPKELTS